MPRYMIGATTSWYSAAAMPKLPSTSKARPALALIWAGMPGREHSHATTRAPKMEENAGNQKMGLLNSSRIPSRLSMAGSTPTRK